MIFRNFILFEHRTIVDLCSCSWIYDILDIIVVSYWLSQVDLKGSLFFMNRTCHQKSTTLMIVIIIIMTRGGPPCNSKSLTQLKTLQFNKRTVLLPFFFFIFNSQYTYRNSMYRNLIAKSHFKSLILSYDLFYISSLFHPPHYNQK